MFFRIIRFVLFTMFDIHDLLAHYLGTPMWAYIMAAVGLFLLFLLVVVLILVLLAKRRKKSEWHRYKDDDRYIQL
jgi:hypothetical protein